jgi:hypothetical protein
VGASKNFNRVFELSSGVYFKWAAHDDLLEPEFLTKCVEVLDKDPSAALCHSKTVCIDENGKLIDSYECDNEGDSQEPHERFRDQLSFFKPSWKIFGVIRANLLRKTLVMGDYIGADRNLLVDLSLLGRIYEIPECLFFGRIHPQSYSYKFHKENWSFSDYRGRFLWWTEADKNLEIVYPHWKNCREYYRSIRRAPLTWLEQLLCLVEFGKWLIGEGMWVVGYNIYIAFRPRSRLLRKLDAVALKLMTCFREGVLRAK